MYSITYTYYTHILHTYHGHTSHTTCTPSHMHITHTYYTNTTDTHTHTQVLGLWAYHQVQFCSNLNSRPHACADSTLLAEPYPQPCVTYLQSPVSSEWQDRKSAWIGGRAGHSWRKLEVKIEVREASRKSLMGEWVSTVGRTIRTADSQSRKGQARTVLESLGKSCAWSCFALGCAEKLWQILVYPGCLWHFIWRLC